MFRTIRVIIKGKRCAITNCQQKTRGEIMDEIEDFIIVMAAIEKEKKGIKKLNNNN
jgi:hypothetical protein